MAVFPRRLFEILNLEDPNIVGWNEDGKSFQIHNTIEFTNKILPRYFRHCKLTSFQRQLNLYGFQRIHVGPLDGSYHHPKFQRGCYSLISELKRTVRKPTGGAGEEEDDDHHHESGGGGGIQNNNHNPQLKPSFSNSNILEQISWPQMMNSQGSFSSTFSTPWLMGQTQQNAGTTSRPPPLQPTQPSSSSSSSSLPKFPPPSIRTDFNKPKNISTTSSSPSLGQNQDTLSPLSPKSPKSTFFNSGMNTVQHVSSFDSSDWQQTVELLQHGDSDKSLVHHNVPGGRDDNENEYPSSGITLAQQRMKESRRLSSSSRASMERGGPMKKERLYSQPSLLNIRDQTFSHSGEHSSIDAQSPISSPFASVPPEVLHQLLSNASKDNLQFEKYVELSDHLISTLGEKEALTISLALLAQVIPRSRIPLSQAELIMQYQQIQELQQIFHPQTQPSGVPPPPPPPPTPTTNSSYSSSGTGITITNTASSKTSSNFTISTPGIDQTVASIDNEKSVGV